MPLTWGHGVEIGSSFRGSYVWCVIFERKEYLEVPLAPLGHSWKLRLESDKFDGMWFGVAGSRPEVRMDVIAERTKSVEAATSPRSMREWTITWDIFASVTYSDFSVVMCSPARYTCAGLDCRP